MIFMSQSGLTDPAREPGWDEWYAEHLKIMAQVPGFYSAQRFKTEHPDHPRSLAMYGVASGEVFQDPFYLKMRGMGEWKALIDPRQYKRNLFDGADRAPRVSAEEVLLVADREAPDPQLPVMTWLRAVAIDLSTAYRGIAVVPGAQAEAWAARGDIALYRPFQ